MLQRYERIFRRALLFFVLATIAMTGSAHAVTISLAWEAPVPSPDGYALYARLDGQAYDYNQPVYHGADPYCTITIEDDGIPRHFVVRAYIGSQYSEDSNEVDYTPPLAGSPSQPDSELDPDETSEDSPSTEENAPNHSITALWPNGEKDVDLIPILIISDEDDLHPHTISWKISLEEDMSSIVLSATTSGDNFSFEVPETILETETQYYWQAVLYDENSHLIAQTQVAAFLTIISNMSDDKNSDGIPDHQEIQGDSDLDNNGEIDTGQKEMLCVKTAKGEGGIAVKSLTADAMLVALKSEDDLSCTNTLNKPDFIIHGLLSFKMLLQNAMDRADVSVYFPEAVPQAAKWYKYNIRTGWQVVEDAIFSQDRKSVTFTLIDGGSGDEDGVQNSVIVDPSGVGIMTQSADGPEEASVPSGGNSDSCFIDSLLFR